MAQQLEIKNLDQVVVRFSGDSGDGMQLAGNIFSTVSATVGNGISTFPDYPADIRAPQGSLTGVSGFQVHIGAGRVYTPGDLCDVLVAMNAAALKTQLSHAKPQATIIIDTDSFEQRDLEKAQFQTADYLSELNIDRDRVVACPITQMVKQCLADSGMDNKSILKCRNMFALGLVCWLFDRDLTLVENFLREKFAKKPDIAENNIKVVHAGYDYGHNVHASVPAVYRVESKTKVPGRYMDITGNKATAYGLIAAAEKAGLHLYLGSYPITPATDILHELAKHKSLGVTTVQCEDEISGCASAVGAAFAGALAATSPTNCFDAAFMAAKIALEHLTPVVLLTDAYIANGSAAWKLPKMADLPTIKPHYATPEMKGQYTPYKRDPETAVRYWAIPGQEGYTHILGGLEKDGNTGAISTEPENHDRMDHLRYDKVARIPVPNVEVQGDKDDAELLIVGFGGTYGHLYTAMEELRKGGHKVALAHFEFINPLPANTAEVLKRYPKVVVAEQNLGQFAGFLRIRVPGFAPYKFNQVKGQPFVVSELVSHFEKIIKE